MKIKAVVDTNVLISGIFWRGVPFEILRAWQQGSFTLVTSLLILEEYWRVLTEVKAVRGLAIPASILELIELHSLVVEQVSFPQAVCDDPDDDKFLETQLPQRLIT